MDMLFRRGFAVGLNQYPLLELDFSKPILHSDQGFQIVAIGIYLAVPSNLLQNSL